MNLRLLTLLAAAVLLAGCATFTESEVAHFRQRGIPPDLLSKLTHRRSLLPEELIELKRAGVTDEQLLRHLDRAGVGYLVTRSDVLRLRKAGISARVIDALLRESDRLAARLTEPPDYGYASPYYGFYDPWYPEFYGGWTVGVGSSFGHHRHYRR